MSRLRRLWPWAETDIDAFFAVTSGRHPDDGHEHSFVCRHCGVSALGPARWDRAWSHYADDCPVSPTGSSEGLDAERLARALQEAEVGCLGFGGFHGGNDPETSHRRDAEAVVREYAAEKPSA